MAIGKDPSKASMERATGIPKPYSFVFHPYKSWLDVIVSYLMTLLLPFASLAKLPANEDNEETKTTNQKLRDGLAKMDPSSNKPQITKWGEAMGEDIVQVTIKVPRNRDVLQEWGLPMDFKEGDLEKLPTDDILVTLRMPLSVCGKESLASTGKNEFGCRTLEDIDLSLLPNDVPFCISIHGGGLTIGTRYEAAPVSLTSDTSAAAGRPIIWASVEYSLAPTYVFPAAPMDCLTVLSYFIEKMPDRSFHMMGVSAGGNLAAVISMELYRRHPEKLASLTSLIPMIDPAGDSLSYYMNRSSSYAPSQWLRWCWRCYLALPSNEADDSVDIFLLKSLDKRLQHGSNRTAWEASPWQRSPLARLVDPTLDLPPGLSKDSAFPVIVLTNKGDPLHDDGIKLIRSLRDKGVNVKHLDHPGSHWLGTSLNAQRLKELVDAWKELVFGY